MQRRTLMRATLAAASGWSVPAARAAPPTEPASQPTARLATVVACPAISAQGHVHLIGNSFPALQHIARVTERCTRPGLKVAFKLTPQARTETEQAFASAGVSPFDAAVVSMGVFSNLYSRRELFAMTALVEKYAARYRIEERMLVRVDGQVMAIAFMQNTQNLYYRQDLFERHRLNVPSTYAEMLSVAAQLRTLQSDMPAPVAQCFGKGFDIATEFTNVLASLGGRYFEPSSAAPAFHGPLGVQAVETLRSVLPFMSPNALASNADDVMNQLQQGRAAMGVLWASRASRMDDPLASKVVGKMAFAAAPAARAGGKSAAHLWWDGVVLPRRSAAPRDTVFQVLMEGLSEAAVKDGNELAIWVRSSYQPGRFGTGVAAAQKAGAPVWPGEPFFALAHAEVGKALPDAMAGQRSAQAVLAGAATAYARVAREKGFVNT